VPLIVGTNLEEMKLYRFLDPAVDALTDAALVERCGMVFPGAAADGRSNAERAVEVYREARRARGDEVSPAELWLAIATDQTFRAGALRLAELHAAHTPDVFVYEFAWKGATPGKPQGAVHALDLPFVFGTLDSSELGVIAGRTPAARALSAEMQEAWLAFARTGVPRSPGLPEWPRYAPPRRATLELAERSRVVEAPREAERRWFDPFITPG